MTKELNEKEKARTEAFKEVIIKKIIIYYS